MVSYVELAQLPLLLGISGSAYRLWDMQLDKAEHAIRTGLEISADQEGRGHSGDLLQRLSYVVADRGDYAEALRIADKAMRTYVLAEDMAGVGKSLVDQGVFLHYLGRIREAIRAKKMALRYLPSDQTANRCTALHVLGLDYHKLREWHIDEEPAAGRHDLRRRGQAPTAIVSARPKTNRAGCFFMLLPPEIPPCSVLLAFAAPA